MKPLIVPFFISHQGCLHQCVFCNQSKITGIGGKLPGASELLDKIAAYRASGRRKSVEVAFYGGTFTSLPRPVMERLLLPLQPLLARGEIGSIRVSTRPDSVDAGIAEFLFRLGVRTVELGVQSMDDEVLALSGRGHTVAHTEEACRALRAAGVEVGMQLMPGLPGDTQEKTLSSLNAVLALCPDFLRIYPTLVIVGTKLATLYETGQYTPLSLDEAVRLCKMMLHAALSAEVKVIRIGLQPTGELEASGSILAGPYHPAFRQLVESALYYDLLSGLAGDMPAAKTVTIFCAPARVSDITGQKQRNLKRLLSERGVNVAAVISDPSLSCREILVESGQVIKKGNIVHDLDYRAEGTSLGR
jgi:histone acetyltransferase (RNA polymerase elongator complex component)